MIRVRRVSLVEAAAHKDDVVESTTSRPLQTVGTTLAADPATHTRTDTHTHTHTNTI